MVRSAPRASKVEEIVSMRPLKWEHIVTTEDDDTLITMRADVPGGWLVWIQQLNEERYVATSAVTFFPDPTHAWNVEIWHNEE